MARGWPAEGRSVKSGRARGQAGDHGTAADASVRRKDYLTAAEIAVLLDAAKAGRPRGPRPPPDAYDVPPRTAHGLRVSEATGLRRDEVDLDRSRMWVRRLKGGLSVEHPMAGRELRAVRRHLAARSDALPRLFVSERSQPLTRQSVDYLVAAAARRAELGSVHPIPTWLAPFLQPRAGQQGLRPALDPGLPRPPRSPAHRPLHPHRRHPLQGAPAPSPHGQIPPLRGHGAHRAREERPPPGRGAARVGLAGTGRRANRMVPAAPAH